MKNAVTVDLEDFYQVTAFSASHSPAQSSSHESRVEHSTELVLEILAEGGCVATFFAVGSIAERFPHLIQRVVRAGHEIACHSFAHRQVFTQSRDEFYEDTRRAKFTLEDAAGSAVSGYRAPSFSITEASKWAFEVLAELRFSYDSSTFPIRHFDYGMPKAPRFPFIIRTRAGSIVEFPMPTLQIAGSRAPLAGGAYLRLLPYWYTRWGIRYLNNSENRPACVYVHPWEFDPEQPRMEGKMTARMRHYFGLWGTQRKFRRLLEDFEFQPLGVLVKELACDLPGVLRQPLREFSLSELSSQLGNS
jgi:polysaccharide deacetylase family protein (PEP-CTERM system associated)